VNAQDQLKQALREDLAPQLRELGFRGTERKFSLPSERYFAQIGIQSSDSSTRELVKFTVNLSVIDKAAWARARDERSYLPVKPSLNVSYLPWRDESEWHERIGRLLDGEDKWWLLDSEGAWREEVVLEVFNAIAYYGLPAMKTRME